MGGPDIDHKAGLTVPRRSLYFRHAAEKQMEFLQIFDAAGVTECYRRKDSILPQQALALANSELSLQHGPPARPDALGPGRAPTRPSSSRPRSNACSRARPTDAERAECLRYLGQDAASRTTREPGPCAPEPP